MNQLLRTKAEKIRDFLDDHNGKDTVIVDVSDRCSWTECFIICTVTSAGHLKGLTQQLWGILSELDLSVNNRHKSPSTDTWELIDCNNIVIHLMNREYREFYNLEKLWELQNSTS